VSHICFSILKLLDFQFWNSYLAFLLLIRVAIGVALVGHKSCQQSLVALLPFESDVASLGDSSSMFSSEGESVMNDQIDETTESIVSEQSQTLAEPPRPEVRIDEAGASVCYANFCRVTGTPEELILDFGLNAQPMGGQTNVEVRQRLIVNYFTAKRLFQALGMSIRRHESAFGVLETDVQKRVTSVVRRASAAG
jgi:Protein of unknown function (DUF3467)